MAKISAELLDVLERIERLHPEWAERTSFPDYSLRFKTSDGIQIEMSADERGHIYCSIKIRQIHEDGSEPAVIYDKSFSQLYETTDCIYLYDYIKSTALNVWAAKRDAKETNIRNRQRGTNSLENDPDPWRRIGSAPRVAPRVSPMFEARPVHTAG